jgi:molybdopterin-guanine dinucleotide biosynthesis protein A
MITDNNATLAIQAGGASKRMGRDKALLPFLGKPLILRVIERASMFCTEMLITANEPEKFRFLDIPTYPDPVSGAGPLAGLYSAFLHAETPYVAVVGCDMPFVSPDLLGLELVTLIENDADVVIPRSADGLEPLHAVYRREACLNAVKTALDQGNLRLIGWMSQVKVIELPLEQQKAHDPQGLAFVNVNSPEELQQAIEIALDQAPDEPGKG